MYIKKMIRTYLEDEDAATCFERYSKCEEEVDVRSSVSFASTERTISTSSPVLWRDVLHVLR